jgi:hypothetical protein
MSKDSDKFFTPKSIFRGTNADGSKFKVTEWEPGSLGEFTGDGSTIGYMFLIILMIVATPIILPIMLLYSLFTYNGRIQISSILGLLISIFPLYCLSETGRILKMHQIAYGIDNIPIIKSIIIGALVGQIALIFTSIITKGSLYIDDAEAICNETKTRVNPKLIVIIIALFYVGFIISLTILGK